MNLDNIGEGACPDCGIRLEIHEDHGRCPDGHGCYSASTDEFTFYVHLGLQRPLRYARGAGRLADVRDVFAKRAGR